MIRQPMQRRDFLTLLGASAAAWPLAARAQQSPKLPTIGFLGATNPALRSEAAWGAAFVQRLRELGWNEGRNLAIEYRWADAVPERYSDVAADLVRLRPDVIFTTGTLPTRAAMQATSTIPIVFAGVADPIGSDIVESLARPRGNVTGMSNQNFDTVGKRLELLREAMPGLRRLAVLVNPDSPVGARSLGELQVMTRRLGLELVAGEARRTDEIAPAFDIFKSRTDALYIINDAIFTNSQLRIVILALGARLPTMYSQREYVDAGGLMSFGTNNASQWRRAADYVDRILRGGKPAELPVEQPTRFDLVVNLITAKAMGLTIPESFLLRANEVIE
jgi:putative ABC transport system substrate-binding protein